MSSNGDEDNDGPSVESENPEERIAARRTRITRRIEAAKRFEWICYDFEEKNNKNGSTYHTCEMTGCC